MAVMTAPAVMMAMDTTSMELNSSFTNATAKIMVRTTVALLRIWISGTETKRYVHIPTTCVPKLKRFKSKTTRTYRLQSIVGFARRQKPSAVLTRVTTTRRRFPRLDRRMGKWKWYSFMMCLFKRMMEGPDTRKSARDATNSTIRAVLVPPLVRRSSVNLVSTRPNTATIGSACKDRSPSTRTGPLLICWSRACLLRMLLFDGCSSFL
mmetsp:Transcript_59993/g.139758  ORF Transcript_59993/g.139758 Transcript_59993/m.139758 type:complete len:208 (+) Transcript_59993:713-1336(+)